MKYLFLVGKSIPNQQIINEYYKYLNPSECTVIRLWQPQNKKKPSVKEMRDWFSSLDTSSYKYVLVCDGDWFKGLYKPCKPDTLIGYVVPMPNHSLYMSYVPSIAKIFYEPDRTKAKIKQSLEAILAHEQGTYHTPGEGIIHNGLFPESNEDILKALQQIYNKPALTCDIETFGLKHYSSGLASITFCWDEHSGIAFTIDKSLNEPNKEIRYYLKEFFKAYKGTLIYHNISFDVYILIYQLFMKDSLDTKGLLYGLDVMLKDFEDTMLITYLATNSASGNHLSLKEQSQEFAGNYAQEEIGDVSKIDTKTLLEYNLTDGLSTWYVYNKYYQKMINDNQKTIYETIFKPAVKDIIQMQLTGIPVNMNQVLKVEKQLQNDLDTALNKIQTNKYIVNFTKQLNIEWVKYKNRTLKKKRVTIDDAHEVFNPNSNVQLANLLYSYLNLPIINTTETKNPSTNGDTLATLKNHTQDQDILNLLDALLEYAEVDKILTAFIPAFKKAYHAKDNWHYLCGNFRLGGTVSGRLSSNSPNLQQIPATGTKYAKVIKSCFSAPEGWLFVGIDFASLEDRISALTTKDKNKLKVYLEHYDGHCLRSYSYFKNQMSDITEQLEEIKKDGKVYKITHDDGSVEYLNENNPKLKEYQNESKF